MFAALFAWVALVNAGAVQFDLKRDSASPLQKRLAHSLARRAAGEPAAPGSIFAKRDSDNTDDIALVNEKSYYSADILVGTPGQNITVLIDTGSSDLWVMSSSNPYCSSGLAQDKSCGDNLIFDQSKSSTFSANESDPFEIQYGDGTYANGTYAQDVVVVGSINITNANFALASEANSSSVVWGIGLRGTEAEADTLSGGSLTPSYSNLPIQMKEQGYIDSVAYSLWLDRISESSGSLLFGGVDHSKYTGSLQVIPMLKTVSALDSPSRFEVVLDSIGYYDSKGQSSTVVDSSFPVLLDSGTTMMMLPADILSPLMDSIGARYDHSEGVYVIECNASGGLTFDFSGAVIAASIEDITIPIGGVGGKDYCLVGIYPTSGDYILGDTFLRSAYVVFDLENYEVGIANASRTTSKSENVEAISSGIPSASRASGYSNTAVASGVSVAGGGGTAVGGQGGDPTASLSSLLLGTGGTMEGSSGASNDGGNSITGSGWSLTLASCILFLI